MKKHVKKAVKYLEKRGYAFTECVYPQGDGGDACIIVKKEGVVRFVTVRKKAEFSLDRPTRLALERAAAKYFAAKEKFDIAVKFDVMAVEDDDRTVYLRDWPNTPFAKGALGAVEGRDEPCEPVSDATRERAVEAVRNYLENNGWTCLQTGWTCLYGTVDITAIDDDDILVFVEVAVSTPTEDIPEKPVPQWEETRVQKVFSEYVSANPSLAGLARRYDAIGLKVIARSGALLRHSRNAFDW